MKNHAMGLLQRSVLLVLCANRLLQAGAASSHDCANVYVRWARVRINLTPVYSGSHSLGTCMSFCSDETQPEKPASRLPCAAFNYKYGSNAASSECQFFEQKQMKNIDWYAEANDQCAFFMKHCVPAKNACKSTHQFDFYTDRFMDESLIDRSVTVDGLEACLALCLDEVNFTCRSVTFNRTSLACKLSSHSRMTHPKMVKVNNNPNYRIDYYDNNCQNSSVQLTHKCKEDGILVSANSKFSYTGAMYGLYDFFTCRVEPKEQTNFEMFFPYPSVDRNCSESIVLEGQEYILDVVVSLDGIQPLYFVTDQDLIYQARCPKQFREAVGAYPSATVGTALDMHPASSSSPDVPTEATFVPVTSTSSSTTTEAPLTTIMAPVINASEGDVHFDILHNGQSVKAVVIGNKITLQFHAPSIAASRMSLLSCQIEPINSPYAWERDPLQIIRNGCQADGVGLVCPPQRSASGGVQVIMEAFRYTTTSEVLFSCLIRNCGLGTCPNTICGSVEGCGVTGDVALSPDDVRAQSAIVESNGAGDKFAFSKGDHVVSRQLIVVNSVYELQYFLKTGNVPNGLQNAGFFQG